MLTRISSVSSLRSVRRTSTVSTASPKSIVTRTSAVAKRTIPKIKTKASRQLQGVKAPKGKAPGVKSAKVIKGKKGSGSLGPKATSGVKMSLRGGSGKLKKENKKSKEKPKDKNADQKNKKETPAANLKREPEKK